MTVIPFQPRPAQPKPATIVGSGPAETGDDPIFAAIARYRRARQAESDAVRAYCDRDNAGLAVCEDGLDAAQDAANSALETLSVTVPTTIEGVQALLAMADEWYIVDEAMNVDKAIFVNLCATAWEALRNFQR